MKRNISIGLFLVAIIAAGTAGYVFFGRDKDSMVTRLLASGGEIHPSPPASHRGESWSSKSMPAVAYSEPSTTDFARWQDELTAQCVETEPKLRNARFDVNNDGAPDLVCWRAVKAGDRGDFFDVIARVKTVAHGVQTAYFILPVNAGVQQAVCGPVESLSVAQEHWTREQFKEMAWDYAGPTSLTITGSDCDPPWLFWPADASGSNVTFEFIRN